MQKLIAIIVSAISLFAGLKQQIKDLKDQLADRDQKLADQAKVIEDLQTQVANDEVDDAALEKAAADARAAADEANAKTAELQAQIDEATAKAEELAQQINDEPSVPNVDSEFNVTSPATQTPTEAELAARQAETGGAA